MKLRLSITNKVLILVVTICILSILATGLTIYQLEKKTTELLVEDELTNTSELAYSMIDSAVKSSVKNYMRAVAEEAKTILETQHNLLLNGEISFEEFKDNTERRISDFKLGESGYIYVIDSEGVLQKHDELLQENLIEYEDIQKIIEMKSGYIEYYWKNPSDEVEREKGAYISYYEPLDAIIVASAYKNEFSDLVLVDEIKEHILNISIGEKGYMFIVDATGAVVAHNLKDNKKTNLFQEIGPEKTQEMIKNKTGILNYNFTNPITGETSEKVMRYKYYDKLRWYICSSGDIEELYGDLAVTGRAITRSVLVIIVLAIYISILLSKKFLEPINTLKDAAKNISLGNYNIDIESKRKDEIGELINSFQEMANSTKEHIEELKEVNEKYKEMNTKLETKVSNRSIELELQNSLLAKEVDARKDTEKLLVIQKNELEQIKIKLEKLVVTDSLTEISNRHHLNDFIQRKWIECSKLNKPISILMIDIDNFKGYNDVYGHIEGDYCLKMVSKALVNLVNDKKDFLARYGGEEFIVLLLDKSEEEVKKISENIRIGIEELKIKHRGSAVSDYVTVSVGVYTVNDYENNTISNAVDIADQALYKAKENGRNQVVINSK